MFKNFGHGSGADRGVLKNLGPVIGEVGDGGGGVGGDRAIWEGDASYARGAASGGELAESTGGGGLAGLGEAVGLWVSRVVCLVVGGVGGGEGAAASIDQRGAKLGKVSL